ncbi:hypothetical protein C8J57DRAFT_1212650 [Mycena rebaudengoi]|nr:hypothetical protein C8J57DRAFT_1212650 [Mycena rebaudengoi]
MTQTAATQTTASPPSSAEMETFVVKVAALSKLAIDLTKLAIEVQTELPRIVGLQIGTVAEEDDDDYLWAAGTPLTPDEMEAKIPPGVGENQTCVDADQQVLGVPNQFRQKKFGVLRLSNSTVTTMGGETSKNGLRSIMYRLLLHANPVPKSHLSRLV